MSDDVHGPDTTDGAESDIFRIADLSRQYSEPLAKTLRRLLGSPGQRITPQTHGEAVIGSLIGLATQTVNLPLSLAAIGEIFNRLNSQSTGK